MATVSTQVRIDSDLKREANALFSQLGLTMSSAINIFLYQVVLHGGLPFDVTEPNYKKEVLEALEECRRLSKDKSHPGFDNVEDLIKSLESDDD